MRLRLVAFGKLKTPGLREAADYYLKLSRSWVEIEEIELKPLTVPDKSPATRNKIQEKEAALLLERLRPQTAIYLLDELGKTQPTREWAALTAKWEAAGDVALCIGSSLGFGEEIREKARGLLSLGPQTLPHELARVVLLEQVYRAFSVTRGHPYHNEG
ncbi:MAG: 23S rRNA (pseudouridine(1915)-N(3))-methyltransferase RlmH [Bdellovibrionota bacterium]